MTATKKLEKQYSAPLTLKVATTSNSTLGFRARLVRNSARVARDSLGATIDGIIGTASIPLAAAGLADPKIATERLTHVALVGDSNARKVMAIWKGNGYKTPLSKTLRSQARNRFTKKKMRKRDHLAKGVASISTTAVDGVVSLPAFVIGQGIAALGKGTEVRDYGYRALVNMCNIPLDLHEMVQGINS